MPLAAVKNKGIFKCFSNYWKELKARSLNIPSILLLVYATLIPVSRRVWQYIINGFVTPLSNNTECSDPNLEKSEVYINLLQYTPFILVPFCGWLSDTKIGRGNAIYLSLWLGWVGTLLQSISYCLQYNSCGITAMIGRYGLSGVAFVLLSVSLAFMYTNILPYGIDQMMNVSSVKIRAFIHWFVWDYFFGLTLCQITFILFANFQTGVLIITVAGFALLSFSLCLHFNLQHHFEHIPIPNPYKIVFKVLKYSIKNSHNRRQRSAFTYWGKEPSRIDLAKERYGGSFTHEQVENVKTFLRILAVIIALVPFFIIYFSIVDGIVNIFSQYKDSQNGSQLHTTYVFLSIGYSTLLVLIPLFELVILPLFPKLEYFLINPLRGLGLANILNILSILSVFLIDLIGNKSQDDNIVPCFNVWESDHDDVIEISYWIFVIPTVLSGLTISLTYICAFEFLCSQAPFGMHGMIIGSFWFLRSIFSGIIIKYVPINSSSGMSCISWLSIIFGLVGLVGLMVYVLTARWYVKRIRDTDLNLRTEVEKQWEQRLIKEDSYNNKNQTDYDTFIISSAEDQT